MLSQASRLLWYLKNLLANWDERSAPQLAKELDTLRADFSVQTTLPSSFTGFLQSRGHSGLTGILTSERRESQVDGATQSIVPEGNCSAPTYLIRSQTFLMLITPIQTLLTQPMNSRVAACCSQGSVLITAMNEVRVKGRHGVMFGFLALLYAELSTTKILRLMQPLTWWVRQLALDSNADGFGAGRPPLLQALLLSLAFPLACLLAGETLSTVP